MLVIVLPTAENAQETSVRNVCLDSLKSQLLMVPSLALPVALWDAVLKLAMLSKDVTSAQLVNLWFQLITEDTKTD